MDGSNYSEDRWKTYGEDRQIAFLVGKGKLLQKGRPESATKLQADKRSGQDQKYLKKIPSAGCRDH